MINWIRTRGQQIKNNHSLCRRTKSQIFK